MPHLVVTNIRHASEMAWQIHFQTASQEGHAINLTPLSNIPGAKIKRYLGNVSFFLIRETSNLREVGGLNSFIQVRLNFPPKVFDINRSTLCTGFPQRGVLHSALARPCPRRQRPRQLLHERVRGEEPGTVSRPLWRRCRLRRLHCRRERIRRLLSPS